MIPRPALMLVLLPLVMSCTPTPQSSQQRADQQTVNACRQRADEVYVRQNRDQIYQTGNDVTPFSAGPQTNLPTTGLSTLYAHDQFINDCVRNTGTEVDRNAGTAGPTADQPPPPARTGPASRPTPPPPTP